MIYDIDMIYYIIDIDIDDDDIRSRSRSRSKDQADEPYPAQRPLALSWARLGLAKLGLAEDVLQQPFDQPIELFQNWGIIFLFFCVVFI